MSRPKGSAKKIDNKYIRTDFRFTSEEHRDLVREAAAASGLSINGWMCMVTLRAAQLELAASEELAGRRRSKTRDDSKVKIKKPPMST